MAALGDGFNRLLCAKSGHCTINVNHETQSFTLSLMVTFYIYGPDQRLRFEDKVETTIFDKDLNSYNELFR
jgi:hypothetical protein